jgi:5-hydroxyisourate hydrolase-like protein (transthyretin family)
MFAQASAAIVLCGTLKGRVEEAQQLLLISSTEFGKQLETLTVTLTQKMKSHACFIRKLETDSDGRLRLTQAR